MATSTSTSDTYRNWPWVRPMRLHGDHAHDDDQGVHRVGVEEPAEQESAQARHLAGCPIVTASWANEPRTSAPADLLGIGRRLGSRTKMKIGIAKIANRTAAMRKIGSGDR